MVMRAAELALQGDESPVHYVISNNVRPRHKRFTIPHDIGDPGAPTPPTPTPTSTPAPRAQCLESGAQSPESRNV